MKNECSLCGCFNRPGWIIDFWNIQACYLCNYDNHRNLQRPKLIEETEYSQEYGIADQKRKEYHRARTDNGLRSGYHWV